MNIIVLGIIVMITLGITFVGAYPNRLTHDRLELAALPPLC
jgi:hypothetical protein